MIMKRVLRICSACNRNLLQFYHPKHVISRSFYRTSNETLETIYNETEKEKILQTVNNSDIDTLSRFKIAKVRARDLVKHRTVISTFNTITEIENSSGFTNRTIKEFFNSIVRTDQHASDKTKPFKLSSQFLHPNLSAQMEQKATRIASVYVDLSVVGWSVIEPGSYDLVEWGAHDLIERAKKPKLADIIDIAWETLQEIPPSSFYVMESPATLRPTGGDPNSKIMHVNLQKQHLLASLVSFLTARNRAESELEAGSSVEPVVYFLKTSLASRFFKTYIGKEKVSSESVINAIMNSNEGVKVPQSLSELYSTQNPYKREILGQCLLINLAFMEICYYRNPASLQNLSRRRNE